MAATGIIPTVDFVFKRLFATEANRELLIHFLNGVTQFPEGHRIVSVEFIDPTAKRSSESDKLTIVDILVRDQAGRSIIIEMQMIVGPAFRERILYYWAREYLAQLEAGQDYHKLRPTILVCVAAREIFSDTTEHHSRFRIQSADGATLFSDRLEIHTIELSKFDRTVDGLATDLDRWTFFLKHGEELDPATLPTPLKVPEIHRAVEVLDVISQTEQDRREYERQLKIQRDDLYLRNTLIGQGFATGQLAGQILLLERLLGEPATPQETLQAMSIEELTERVESLSQRFESGKG